MKEVGIGPITVGNDRPLTVIAGPCQLESRDHALMIASRMAEACAAAGAGYVFKASYDKANRTSLSGKRGVGMGAGLDILAEVRARIGCPVLTDVHTPEQCAPAAEACDILQIPAFLCRQTDLLLAAGETGRRSTSRRASFSRPGTWPTSPPRSPPPAMTASC
jgi:2-dehydro-3-deoxyphosphooctonate aldolase (KDO 8-P synthase)